MAEPAMVRDTHPVAQMPGIPRCEASGSRWWRWCRRDATTIVSIEGDGVVDRWRLCTYHANRIQQLGGWRTDIGEVYTVIGRERCTEGRDP